MADDGLQKAVARLLANSAVTDLVLQTLLISRFRDAADPVAACQQFREMLEAKLPGIADPRTPPRSAERRPWATGGITAPTAARSSLCALGPFTSAAISRCTSGFWLRI